MKRIMAFDFGTVRIGVALSDPLGITVRRLDFIQVESMEKVLTAVANLLQQFDIGEFLIGLPYHMNGTPGALAGPCREFAELLKSRFAIPCTLWDERLTTVQAQQTLREAGMKGRQLREQVDSAAAQLLLQGYLEFLRRPRHSSAPDPQTVPNGGDMP